MGIRLPWPLRRQSDRDSSPSPARGDASPAPGASREATAIEIDPGFAGDFRARASERDTMPLLGPWGGLAETARFAVAATHFPETLVTQRFSDEVAPARGMPGSFATDFIASLGSLASYEDPAGTPGESGSPFADFLPVGRSDLFAPPPSAPVTPAFPSFSSLSSPALARAERPAARATIPARPRPASSPATAPQARPSPSAPVQRSIDSPPAALRPRSTVTEPGSPPVAAIPPVESAAPLPPEPVAPASPPGREADVLPFAAQPPPVDTATSAGASPPLVPAPTVTAADESTVAARTVDPAPPAAPFPSSELPVSITEADQPLPRVTIDASAPAAPADTPDLPLAGRGPEAPPLAGERDRAPIARSVDSASTEPLPLASEPPLPASPQSAPAVPPPQSPPATALPGEQATVTPSQAAPSTAAPPVLVQREPALPPLPDPDVAPAASAHAPPPLTPRVRRFSIGEPLPAASPPVTASSPAPSSVSAARERLSRRSTSEAAVPPALPVARATFVEPSPVAPLDRDPGERSFEPSPLATTAEVGLPLAEPPSPGATDPALPLATMPAVTPDAPPVRRSLDTFAAAATSSPPLLFRDPAAAPLGLEVPPAPARVARFASTDVPAAPASTAAFAYPIPPELPLGPAGSRPAEGGSITEAASSPSQGLRSAQRAPAGFTTGTAAQRAPIVWRASDPGAVSMEAPPEASVAAVGELSSPVAPQQAPEQDLDKLTEKVWQRLRRTLQLERERRRGLP
ncbi:MAG: hypothetical protein WD557_08995 [Dehalococcoidia bacterium]